MLNASNKCSVLLSKRGWSFKVWVFWEGHKIWKNLRRTFDKSVVFCARNSVLVKKSTKIFQNKCGQVVLYKLYQNILFVSFISENAKQSCQTVLFSSKLLLLLVLFLVLIIIYANFNVIYFRYWNCQSAPLLKFVLSSLVTLYIWDSMLMQWVHFLVKKNSFLLKKLNSL